MKRKSIIPKGPYCYQVQILPKVGRKIKICPYWKRIYDMPYQLSGYCRYLHIGDWHPNGSISLWDMCKECDINLDD